MDEMGLPFEEVLARLKQFSSRDHHFDDGDIFGSMCTKPHDAAIKAHMMFLEANLGNRGLYPGTSDMENEVVEDVGTLLGMQRPKGQMLSGGTEANLLALWSAREFTGKNKVLLPQHAHFSFKKACRMLKMEAIEIPSSEKYVLDSKVLPGFLEDNVACVVAVAGITETGLCDPIDEIGRILEGTSIPFHVDAAFGGFVLPFIEHPPRFDFDIPKLTSMTVDPHKMGMGTIPGGILLYRDDSFLKGIRSHAPYLTQKSHYAITGTRGSAGVAAAFSAIKSLGCSGYRSIVRDCMDNTRHLCARAKVAGFPCAFEPLTNVVVLSMNEPEYVYKMLTDAGIFCSTSRNPKGLRIVVMPHVSRENIDALVSKIKEVVTCPP